MYQRLPFQWKIRSAVKSKLVELLKLNNFRVHNFSRFCENFCANRANVPKVVLNVSTITFSMENSFFRQQQTCSAVKTEQLSCLHLFTLLRKLLRKKRKETL